MSNKLINTVRISLSNGNLVRLVFKKKDGSDREAVITRNLTCIPVDKHPKFVRADNPDYICGFDVGKGDWIRFHKDALQMVQAHPLLNA
jgi:hypothetical protein